jgi:hypothetical protein
MTHTTGAKVGLIRHPDENLLPRLAVRVEVPLASLLPLSITSTKDMLTHCAWCKHLTVFATLIARDGQEVGTHQ